MCKQMEHTGNSSNVCCCYKLDNINIRWLYFGHQFFNILQWRSHFLIVIGNNDFYLRYNLVLFQCSYKVFSYMYNCDKHVNLGYIYQSGIQRCHFSIKARREMKRAQKVIYCLEKHSLIVLLQFVDVIGKTNG